MPPTASDAIKNTRPRCTGVAARFHAGSLAVCREGAIVALHLGTPEGTVIVTMRERDFLRGARGPVDHHGHPFRTIEQLDAERQVEIANPESIQPLAPAQPLELAWQRYVSGAAKTMRQAAEQGGVHYEDFAAFVRYNHADESRRLRRERSGTGPRKKFSP